MAEDLGISLLIAESNLANAAASRTGSSNVLNSACAARSTERAVRDFGRLPGMRSRAASCQNEAYPTSPFSLFNPLLIFRGLGK